jgi:hypothetical protein
MRSSYAVQCAAYVVLRMEYGVGIRCTKYCVRALSRDLGHTRVGCSGSGASESIRNFRFGLPFLGPLLVPNV